MAWTRKLPSERYQGLYRDASGRVRTTGTLIRKGDAKSAGDDQEAKMRRGQWLDPTLARTSFDEWAQRWLEGARPTLKPKTLASYESLLRSRVLPAFGTAPVVAIKPSDVTAWIGAMVKEDLSPSRIRQAHVVLRLVLDSAMRDGYVARNAALGIKLPRLAHTEAPYFSPEVVDGLVQGIESPYGALVAVMGICGLRWGEAAALRGRHVDRLRRRLIVEESLAEISGRLIFGATKSHARRKVPVPATLVAQLPATYPDGLLFTAPKGGPLRYQNFLARVWHPTLESLGLPVVGVHVLRHSAAARMIQAGASAKTLQTVLGHRSASFSLTVYGHLFDADLDALADRLDIPARKAE